MVSIIAENSMTLQSVILISSEFENPGKMLIFLE